MAILSEEVLFVVLKDKNLAMQGTTGRTWMKEKEVQKFFAWKERRHE
jgi:hypothetical protein